MVETPSAPTELSSPHTPATYDPGTSCKTIKLINLFWGIIYLHLTPTLSFRRKKTRKLRHTEKSIHFNYILWGTL